MATLPGVWHYRVSAGTGWPSVSILWLGEVESLICNFHLIVAAHKLVWADLSSRFTSMVLGRLSTNKQQPFSTRWCVLSILLCMFHMKGFHKKIYCWGKRHFTWWSWLYWVLIGIIAVVLKLIHICIIMWAGSIIILAMDVEYLTHTSDFHTVSSFVTVFSLHETLWLMVGFTYTLGLTYGGIYICLDLCMLHIGVVTVDTIIWWDLHMLRLMYVAYWCCYCWHCYCGCNLCW